MRNPWPAVAVVIAALICITILSVTGSATGDALQVIATAVIPTVTMMLYGERLATKVDDVHKQVNGRMSELIARNGEDR